MDYGIMQTLNDVKYIQEFMKKLISLGTLQENGFSYKSNGDMDIMKVSKCALIVMRANRIVGNI